MERFLSAVQRLRELEAAAKLDPGHESDHDHITSHAWDAYEEGWRKLDNVIGRAAPAGWIAIEEWCAKNPSRFGDVTYPGVHGAQMRWLDNHRAVRDRLVERVTRRSMERLARPEDAAVWEDPRVDALLHRLGVPSWPTPLAKAFRVKKLSVDAERGFVVIRIAYESEAAKGVILQLIARDSGERIPYTQVELMPGMQLDGFFSDGVTAHLTPGVITIRTPGPVWRSRKIASGTLLSMEVRGEPPWFLAGLARAPEDPGDPHPDDYSRSDLHCAGCGEATPVLIGVSCVPCEVGKLPRARPLSGAEGEMYDALRLAWLETRCPECGGREFAWRLNRPELHSLECKKCRRGWTEFNGTIREPDVIERALATPGPGSRWREVVEAYFRGGADTAAWVKRWLALDDPVKTTPEWGETILLLCEQLCGVSENALLFDSYDRDHHDEVTRPAAEKAAKIMKLL